MTKNKKNIPDLKTFLDYIHNRMNPDRRNALEKQMQRDAFAEEAAEGLSLVDEKRAQKDIEKLNQQIAHQAKARNSFWQPAVAAAVLLLIVSGITFITIEKIRKDALQKQIGYEPLKAPEETIIYETPAETQAAVKQEIITPPAREKTEQTPNQPMQVVEEEIAEYFFDLSVEREIEIELQQKAEHVLSSPTVQGARRSSLIAVPHSAERRAESSDMITITGRIIDITDGSPLPGVSIRARGSKTGTISDIEGNFSLVIPHEVEFLDANFIGMLPMEIHVNDFTEVLAMTPDTKELSEIMIVRNSRSQRSGQVQYHPAEPIVGYSEYQKYLTQNARLPENSSLRRAVVVLSFDVSSHGTPYNFQVVRSPDEILTELAIDLIRNGPGWNPAKQNNRPVEENVRVRIVFR